MTQLVYAEAKPSSDQMGWRGTPDQESRLLQAAEDQQPARFARRSAKSVPPAVAQRWDEFQQSKGHGPGSHDLTLIDEFVFGREWHWNPQYIGSCVWSNTFRGYVRRCAYEIALRGDPEEYLGRDEFGPRSIAPYGPWSYGMMRRRAGIRGGDGGLCVPMSESLMLDGVLPCNTPALLELLRRLGADGAEDLPEPSRSRSNVYRDFGNWKYLDDLKQYADFPLLESSRVRSADEQISLGKEGKPLFQCSGIAVHKVGTHRDGFPIYKRNPRDSWDHNMGWHGHFIASDGNVYALLSNESWGKRVIYPVPIEEVDDWYRRRNVTVMSIGEIQLPGSVPAA